MKLRLAVLLPRPSRCRPRPDAPAPDAARADDRPPRCSTARPRRPACSRSMSTAARAASCSSLPAPDARRHFRPLPLRHRARDRPRLGPDRARPRPCRRLAHPRLPPRRPEGRGGDRESPLPRQRPAPRRSSAACATASLIRRSGWARSPPRARTAASWSTSPASSPATSIEHRRRRCAATAAASSASCRSSASPIPIRSASSPRISSSRPGSPSPRPRRPPRSTTSRRSTAISSFVVRHSLIRLPEPGYRAAPLRSARRLVRHARSWISPSRSASRSSTSSPTASGSSGSIPNAPRSRVRRPIIFYIDRAAPEPIRTALFEGVSWWRAAFEAAGLHRRLPGRISARGRRSARRPLQCRPLGQPGDARLVLRPGDRGSAHRRDRPRPGAARARCGCGRTC